MVRTQAEAKRFFIGKVMAQAGVEKVVLSDAEQRMLRWSESDPDCVVDPKLSEQLASEISDKDYETKIVGLLARSFAADIESAWSPSRMEGCLGRPQSRRRFHPHHA